MEKTKCETCAHKEVCINKEKYLQILDEVSNTIFYIPGGGVVLADFPWIKVEFICKHYYNDFLVREMVLPDYSDYANTIQRSVDKGEIFG